MTETAPRTTDAEIVLAALNANVLTVLETGGRNQAHEDAVAALDRLAACAERGEALETALRDEIAMAEQSAETLRDLHRNWRDYAEELTPDGDEPLLQNMLYWLIEDVEPSAAKAALAGAAPEPEPGE